MSLKQAVKSVLDKIFISHTSMLASIRVMTEMAANISTSCITHLCHLILQVLLDQEFITMRVCNSHMVSTLTVGTLYDLGNQQ